MAGDWIKMEVCTPEKSEVLAITARMGWDDADITVGKLFRVWRWFDQHTTDGNALSVTPALLNRIIGVTGFCETMEAVGWLVISDDGLSLPNFDFHNGKSAKSRAQTAKRVSKFKGNAKGNGEGNGESVTSSVTGALPREEKRREEKRREGKEDPPGKPVSLRVPDLLALGIPEHVATAYLHVRKTKRGGALTELAMAGIKREAAKAGLSLTQALTKCVERNWVGFEAEWLTSSGRPQASTLADHNRAVAQEALADLGLFGGNHA